MNTNPRPRLVLPVMEIARLAMEEIPPQTVLPVPMQPKSRPTTRPKEHVQVVPQINTKPTSKPVPIATRTARLAREETVTSASPVRLLIRLIPLTQPLRPVRPAFRANSNHRSRPVPIVMEPVRPAQGRHPQTV